jgi:cytochrome c-type biogenesis protein CcmH/NrfF
MEGNTLMDELKQVVFSQLRRGESMSQVLKWFAEIEKELLTMKDYAKAMEEAHRAP